MMEPTAAAFATPNTVPTAGYICIWAVVFPVVLLVTATNTSHQSPYEFTSTAYVPVLARRWEAPVLVFTSNRAPW